MNDINSSEIMENFQKITEKYQEIMVYFMQGRANIVPPTLVDKDLNTQLFSSMFEQFIANPEKYWKFNLEYFDKLQNLIKNSVHQSIETKTPLIHNENDKRFKDVAWENNIYFNFVKQFYLLSSELIEKNIQEYNLAPELQKYLHFLTKQFIDAFAPSNFALLNPTVLSETLKTSGSNIVKGLDNLLHDLQKSGDLLNIQMTDYTTFKFGENIAATPGKIIFQNELVQLICYAPKDQTYQIPLLIIPPCINKYYILDLSPHNSMVSYLVENNFQVFMLSFVNPSSALADKTLEDYIIYGLLEPIEFIRKTFKYEKINCHGYCIGGTFLAILLSYLKAHKLDYVNSAGFMATMLDFTNPGEIGVFINESFIANIEAQMEKTGYFDGRYLLNSFSLLRSNDLIWSFFINNYLLGKTPLPFDLLYWNADPTNLPAKMHSYYLRKFYLENLLSKPNSISILGTPIDLGNIDIDSFFLATSDDHIAPWKSVYDSMKLLGGTKKFCLAGSGHVAGVINPPINDKYYYNINKLIDKDTESWLANSTKHSGSWWKYWISWLKPNSSIMVQSINYDELSCIEDAPGTYVQKKITAI